MMLEVKVALTQDVLDHLQYLKEKDLGLVLLEEIHEVLKEAQKGHGQVQDREGHILDHHQDIEHIAIDHRDLDPGLDIEDLALGEDLVLDEDQDLVVLIDIGVLDLTAVGEVVDRTDTESLISQFKGCNYLL